MGSKTTRYNSYNLSPETRAYNFYTKHPVLFCFFYTSWDSTCMKHFFSCDQAALWMVFSVCPSVTPFWLCSHHLIIMKFSGVITLDQGKVHAKGQGQRSKVKVTEVTTQNFVSGLYLQFEFTCDDEMIHIAWCCLGEVPYCFSRSSVKFQGHTALKSQNLTQIGRFRTVTPVWIHQWLWNAAQSLK